MLKEKDKRTKQELELDLGQVLSSFEFFQIKYGLWFHRPMMIIVQGKTVPFGYSQN